MQYTYQDLEAIGDDKRAKMLFAIECITDFQGSPEFRFGERAKMYYEGENPTLAQYQKIIYDMQGAAHVDAVSPNHKIFSRYVFSAITEGTQYLLSNGVSFDDQAIKDNLGGDAFDYTLQKLLDDAQIYGTGWGFWNGEKLSTIPYLEFAPLKDENTSAVKAGVRFWRIHPDKPLRFVLYELDGYTEYILDNDDEEPRILHSKQAYKVTVRTDESGAEDEIVDSENFPDFPIVPLYYINHKSILWGNTSVVDAYDILNSKLVNNIDEGNLVYWVLRNCNAMDEADDERFISQLLRSHVTHADGDEGASAEPHQVEAPVAGTETGIMRVKRLLDDNFMTCDTESIRAGSVTATQIRAAYQKLDAKTAKAEYCVIEFIKRLFVVASIDESEKFTFKWDKTINQTEQITSILQASQFLDEETVTRMLLEVLGKIDIVEDVLQRKQADEMQKFSLLSGENAESGESGQQASAEFEQAAEESVGKGLNGIQINSLLQILAQVAAGSITKSQATSIISVAVGISKEKAREFVEDMGGE